MKTVFAIYAKGEFKQYLMRSELKFLKDMCEAWGKVTVELVEISIAKYKMEFGK